MAALTDAQIQRYRQKANAVSQAWQELFGGLPSLNALVLTMGVAEFETQLGDATMGPGGGHNWGALHKRVLTSGELAKLDAHGITPQGGAAALKAAQALLPAGPNEVLFLDTHPSGEKNKAAQALLPTGPNEVLFPGEKYFVWFWSFPTDREAAKKFLSTLVKPNVRALLDTATPESLARAMYENKYYEGKKTDPEANIKDYGGAIRRFATLIHDALSSGSILSPVAYSHPQLPTLPARPVLRTPAPGAGPALGVAIMLAATFGLISWSQARGRRRPTPA